MGHVGKEDTVLLVLMPVEQDGEENREDNDDRGRKVGCKGPSSEEVLRPGIPCHPDLQKPDMLLTLTEVKQAQCSGQGEGSQHVDESPVPIKCHPLRIRTLVYLTNSRGV